MTKRLCDCTDSPSLAAVCICDEQAEAVLAVHRVREAFLSERNANYWLGRWNTRLGGVPSLLILAGRGADVVDEARRIAGAA